MGQKVHPKSFRIGIFDQWNSKWYSSKTKFRKFLEKDIKIKEFLLKKLKKTGLAKIEIEKSGNKIRVIIYSGRPGMIIGHLGKGVEELKKEIEKKFLEKNEELELNIYETKEPYLSAQVVLENMILDIERRIPYRRVMKAAIEQVKRAGAKGVKVIMSGRLDGVEIARQETLSWGKVPTQTLRAEIDFAKGEAQTIYGKIGIKVWIYKGEKL